MNRNKRPRLEGPESASESQAQSKPQLTRACSACKSSKVKCHMQPGSTSCVKCLRNGIECVPFNFAQKYMDDDTAWKNEANAKIDQLKAAVEHLLQLGHLPELAKYDMARELSQVQTVSPSPTSASSNRGSGGNFVSEGPSAELQEDDDSNDLVPLPMNNLYSLTEPGNSRLFRVDPADVNGPDFIARGVVTLAEAVFLFDHYRRHINPLLWDGVLCPHRTLHEARQSSTLLVATVLTVAALHLPDRERPLHATYEAFVSLMRGSCLLHTSNLDDIRGLCIGAFYLTSLSWSLCSRAVRVATEMNLHKSSLQFARGSLDSYERVRLWYVLYVCDHQFALAYGRPPMMHEDAAIRNADKLLKSGLSKSRGDRRLVAQVNLFRILAGAYFMYGCDPDLELGAPDYKMLQSFTISVDQWRLEHQPREQQLDEDDRNNNSTTTLDGSSSSSQSKIPTQTTTLYYHLARFYLNSMSLRGISARRATQDNSTAPEMTWDRQEAANNAIAAATSTARLVVEDAALREALIGMPIFAHAMIAVCASFLLKMAVAFGEAGPSIESGDQQKQKQQHDHQVLYLPRDLLEFGLNFHTKTALRTVDSLVAVLVPVLEASSQRHVVGQAVTGLRELLSRFSADPEGASYTYSRTGGVVRPKGGGGGGGAGGGAAGVAAAAASMAAAGGNGHEPSSRGHHAGAGDGENEGRLGQASAATGTTAQGTGLDVGGGNGSLELQQDPFDLMGDLDWRFNDSFLWGAMDAEVPYI